MWLLPHGQRLGPYGRGLVARRRLAVGKRVEVARTVETLHERQLGITSGLREVALGVGHEPGILVVAVGVVWDSLDLILDLFQSPPDPRHRVGLLDGRIVGKRVEADQGVDVLRIGSQRLFDRLATGSGIAPETGCTRFEVVHSRTDRSWIASDLLQNRIAFGVSLPIVLAVALALAAFQQPAEAGRGLVFPLLVVQELGEHDRGERELRGRRLRILDERGVFAVGPIGRPPLRQQDGRLEPVDELGVGAGCLRKGRSGERVCLGLVGAGLLGHRRGVAHQRVCADEFGAIGCEQVNRVGQSAFDQPDQHPRRFLAGGRRILLFVRIEAGPQQQSRLGHGIVAFVRRKQHLDAAALEDTQRGLADRAG